MRAAIAHEAPSAWIVNRDCLGEREMRMSGERHIPAWRTRVWEALNDPEILRQAMDANETIAGNLTTVARLLRKNFDERARQNGLTRPQWQVLTVLARYDGINQSGMAEILEVAETSVGRMILRMQHAEVVERRRQPSNRRSWCIYLTPRGKVLAARLQSIAEASREQALAGVSPFERARLSDLLTRMRDNLSQR